MMWVYAGRALFGLLGVRYDIVLLRFLASKSRCWSISSFFVVIVLIVGYGSSSNHQKNHQRKPDRSPSKLPLKKPKLTFGTAEAMDECHSSRDDGDEVTHIGQAMAAPMAKKLSFEGDDSTENEPPKWFKHYEMRLDQRWSKLDQVVERFETLVLKVEEHDKKTGQCTV